MKTKKKKEQTFYQILSKELSKIQPKKIEYKVTYEAINSYFNKINGY